MPAIPRYYECDICSAIHPWDWDGDCREDAARFHCDTLDAEHGPFGYELRRMDDRTAADFGEPTP